LADRTGGGVTVTENPHELVRCWASVATHVTGVAPIENNDPLGGVHVVVTGALPFETTGADHVTATGDALRDWTTGGAGHAMVGGVVGTAAGVVGLPHVLSTHAQTHHPAARAAFRKKKLEGGTNVKRPPHYR
jgi:hypothetical protein